MAKAPCKSAPREATPAWALMAFARLSEAWSRVSGKEPDVTPEGAMLTCHVLHVDSAKARRELDYVETPIGPLPADALAWMREQRMIGGMDRPG